VREASNTPKREIALRVQIKKGNRYTSLHYLQIFNKTYCSGILRTGKNCSPEKLFLVLAQQGLIHSFVTQQKISTFSSGDFMIRDVQNASFLRLIKKREIITSP